MENEADFLGIATTARLRYDNGSCILATDSSNNSSLLEDDGFYEPKIEYTIKGIDMELLRPIVSEIGWKSFASMLSLMFGSSKDVGATSVFEIMHVCTKMKSLEIEKMTEQAKKYIYTGLLEEASALKNKSIEIECKPVECKRNPFEYSSSGRKKKR